MSVRELAGTVLADRYALERELGSGGMATVWRARDVRHDRLVAIKVLHPELAGAIGADRFIREVRMTARLQHPNIVPILDSGVLQTADGTSLPWYAMAYLDGESLRARLDREQQLPIDEALRITDAVGSALDAAHDQGIVHRDVKPENIFLSQGRIYVVDFGIAKALLETDPGRLTSTGIAIGTPAYMSPEQAVAGRVDARSDQYNLAAVTYEMLAGEPPFSGPSSQAIIARRIVEPARPLRPVRSTVSEAVERAVLRALERAPADRFPSVQEYTAALRSAEPARTFSLRGWMTRTRIIAAATILAAAASGSWLWASRSSGIVTKVADPEVVRLYQRGVREYDRRTPAGVIAAIDHFDAVIGRDSAYAPAWNALANAYIRALQRGAAVPRGAMRAWRRGVMVGPKYTQGLAFLALGHHWRGSMDSAAFWADSTVAVDPTYLLGRTTLGQIAIERGDFARATAAFDASRRLSTDVENVNALAGIVLAGARAGGRAAALADIRRVDSLAAKFSPTPLHTAVFVAHVYAALGNADRAVQWLRRYEPQRDLHFQLHLRCDPSFKPIAKDERFRALLVLLPPPSGQRC